MFLHRHPYKPIIHKDTEKLIVGTLPPPRFSTGDLLEKDVDFPYGSYYNSLWLYIDKINNLNLTYDNSQKAAQERLNYLKEYKIGICDIVESAERDKIDASDAGMKNVELRNLIEYLIQYPKIKTLLFTGGNSKNGPEYFFRKHIREYDIKLKPIITEVPRIHKFHLPNLNSDSTISINKKPNGERVIKTVSLTSASGSANRAIGSMALYKQLKAKNPRFTTFDFRVMQYKEFF